MHTEILQLIHDYPGILGSDISATLQYECRNTLSDLINKSCIYQDAETSGFYLSPGGKHLLGVQAQLAA